MTLKTRVKKEHLRYHFTDEEKAEIAKELAKKTAERATAEEDKKAVASKYKAEIDTMTADINVMADHINSGFEHRYVLCDHVPDIDSKVWRVYRQDNNEHVKDIKMTADELQYQIESAVDESAVES